MRNAVEPTGIEVGRIPGIAGYIRLALVPAPDGGPPYLSIWRWRYEPASGHAPTPQTGIRIQAGDLDALTTAIAAAQEVLKHGAAAMAP